MRYEIPHFDPGCGIKRLLRRTNVRKMEGEALDRVILHCDLNSFYASVELLDRPDLVGKAVAVCGSVEDRHGIVLAKSDLAKRYGVRTGEPVWQAKQKCYDLVILPPHYDKYVVWSDEVQKIYCRYTDQVESFGMDECWLDVTGSRLLFGDGERIAHDIRETVKRETGLTISVGVSFNKVFAKLGSDMKKPDAVTCIPRDCFKELIWDLPVGEMFGVGPSCAKTLWKYGIATIGQLAALDVEFCRRTLGKIGGSIWAAANGMADISVARYGDYAPIKSIGHGNTTKRDMVNNDEVRAMFFDLSQDVSHRLRQARLCATKVQICIKNNELSSRDAQCPLAVPTQNWRDLAMAGYALFLKVYRWEHPIRALTIRAIDLVDEGRGYQTDLFFSEYEHERQDKRELALEGIRHRYGKESINIASLVGIQPFPATPETVFNALPVPHLH